jgi:Tfp pilus assembly protein PilO
MPAASLKASSKSVTALIVVAAVVLFGCLLTYVAAAGKIKAAVAELERKEKEVAESRLMAQKLEKSKLDYLDARSQVRNLEASVSTKEYVPTMLKQLEHLGRSVNLKVLSVRPAPAPKTTASRSISSGAKASEGNVEAASKPKSGEAGGQAVKKPAQPYTELKVDLEIEGRYMNALDFLYKLTSFPKIVAVNAVEIQPESDKAAIGAPRLTVKMNATAFVLKDDPVVEPDDAAREPAARGIADSPARSKGGAANAAG